MNPPTLRGVFVTGTDTGVGKTVVASGLISALGALGVRTVGFKPVAAGTHIVNGQCLQEDVFALSAASNVDVDDAEVCPIALNEACAPHIAARLEHLEIDRARIVLAARALSRKTNLIVAEGAGGLRVPLGNDWDSADLIADLGMPVVLVVGMRLGCLNHALLTAEALRARGIAIAGWVANRIDPAMPHAQENLATLDAWLGQRQGIVRLGDVPALEPPEPFNHAALAVFAKRIATYLDARALARILGLPVSSSPSLLTPLS
ncbi:MAG TPA: dethiobiotin synthase [Burkholderiaceae bacterium]|nr:dethiobiotin synthase [Burkholderiaceae bacterium]